MPNPSIANASIEQLRDIHLPAPIGIWPLAPGWYGLFILGLLCASLLLWRYRRTRVRRHALMLLTIMEHEYRKALKTAGGTNPANRGTLREKTVQDIALNVSDVLRRVALVYFPRGQVASLKGKDWIDFLSTSSKGLDFNDIQALLIDLPYQKSHMGLGIDLAPLFVKSRAWIKQRGSHV